MHRTTDCGYSNQIDNVHNAPHIAKPENNTKERIQRLQKPEDRSSIRRLLSVNVGKA